RATEYFRQAIDKDPSYGLAWAGLADSYVLYGYYGAGSPREADPRAKETALTALRIDDTLAEAQTALGWVKMDYDWDWSGAEKELKRGIELSPQSGTAHQRYAGYLEAMARMDDDIAECKRAQEMEPQSLIVNSLLGRAFYRARQYDQAIAEL